MPLFIRRPVNAQVFEAQVLQPGAQATVSQGRPPRPGDYVVTDHQSGATFALTADEFNTQFEPLNVPGHILAAEHQAQQEQRTMAAIYQPEVTPDLPRTPGWSGQPNPSFGPGGEPVDPPAPPQTQGGGDVSPVYQPMTEDLSGRPSPTPEVRPRLGELGENAPVTTPTGIPAQPAEADATHAQQQNNLPEQSPTGQPG